MNTLVASCLLMVVAAPPVQTSATPSTRLYVRTTPSGASVQLDAPRWGKSDGLFVVPAGVGKLTITLDGKLSEVRQVEVSEGRITRLEVDLKQAPEALKSGAVQGSEKPKTAASPKGSEPSKSSSPGVATLSPGQPGRRAPLRRPRRAPSRRHLRRIPRSNSLTRP